MKRLIAVLVVLGAVSAMAEPSLYDRMVAYYEATMELDWPEFGQEPWQLSDDGYGNISISGADAPAISDFNAFPVPVKVPQVVTKFRFWLAFFGATGLSNRDVESAILSWEDGPDKAQALIALDSARDYRRDHLLVETLRVQAEMTEEQMDAVFIAASQLEVD